MLFDSVFDRVLVISPHADDEVIGCGGLMKKVVNHGGEVHVAVVAVGDINFYHLGRVVTKEERKNELRNALEYIGVTNYYTLFDDYESLMDTLPMREVVTAVERLIGRIQPTTVLLPYPSFHQDHKVVFNAGFAALRPAPGRTSFLQLVAGYEYPLVTWSNEQLNSGSLYVDISEEMVDKIEALKCYSSQMREERHLISPQSVQLWAEKRGLEAGIRFSEMLHLLRMTV